MKRETPGHLCAQVHEDDGRPVSRRSSRKPRRKTRTRKRDQLCRQTQYSIQSSLHTITSDEDLLGLIVTRVAPHQTHLLVYFAPAAPPEHEICLDNLQRKLTAVEHILRHHLAADIHRKYVPQLRCVLDPFYRGK